MGTELRPCLEPPRWFAAVAFALGAVMIFVVIPLAMMWAKGDFDPKPAGHWRTMTETDTGIKVQMWIEEEPPQ